MRPERRQEPERILSADEVAELLGMSRDWVYDQARARALLSCRAASGRVESCPRSWSKRCSGSRGRGGGGMASIRTYKTGKRRSAGRFAGEMVPERIGRRVRA